jgi:hypothetical protein
MAVAFLPFATSVLAGALRSGHGQRTAVAFYRIAFDVTALTFNAVWQYDGLGDCVAVVCLTLVASPNREA